MKRIVAFISLLASLIALPVLAVTTKSVNWDEVNERFAVTSDFTAGSGFSPDIGKATHRWKDLHLSGSIYASGTMRIEDDVIQNSLSAGSEINPIFTLFRDSASPTSTDTMAGIRFDGRNSVGTQLTYIEIRGEINNAVSGSEDGLLIFDLMDSGTKINAFNLDAFSSLGGAIFDSNAPISADVTAFTFDTLNNMSATDTIFQVGDDGGVNIITFFEIMGDGVVSSTKLLVNGNTTSTSLEVTGTSKSGGGSAGKAMCWKADGKTLGYCSSAPDGTGSCTCN